MVYDVIIIGAGPCGLSAAIAAQRVGRSTLVIDKFGYGGKCFPKDVNAFAKMTAGTPLGTLLEHLHELNVHFRGFEEHI